MTQESLKKLPPFERYQAYIISLEQAGAKLPISHLGDLNLSQVSKDSGCRRQWFSESAKKKFGPSDRTLEEIIQSDIKRLGTDLARPNNPDVALSDIADTKSKEANLLRHMLEQKSKENEQLRDENQRLQIENKLLRGKASEIESQQEEMLESGRSFSF